MAPNIASMRGGMGADSGMRRDLPLGFRHFDPAGRGGNQVQRFPHQAPVNAMGNSMGPGGNFGRMRGDNLPMMSAQSGLRFSQGGMEGMGGGNGIYGSAAMQAAAGRGMVPMDEGPPFAHGGWSPYQSQQASGPDMHSSQPFGAPSGHPDPGTEIDDLLNTTLGAGDGSSIVADLGLGI